MEQNNTEQNKRRTDIISFLYSFLEIDVVSYEPNPGQSKQENMFYINDVIILYPTQQSKSESNNDIIQADTHQVYPGMLAHALTSKLGRLRQEDFKFQLSDLYIVTVSNKPTGLGQCLST